MHRIVKTVDKLIKILEPLILDGKHYYINDLCSGNGGPMINILEKLKKMINLKT